MHVSYLYCMTYADVILEKSPKLTNLFRLNFPFQFTKAT